MQSRVIAVGPMAANRYVLLAALLFLTASVDDLSACSCWGPFSPAAEFERVDAVFSGVVEAVRIEGFIYEVTIRVIDSWKGITEKRVTVYTTPPSPACGYHFEQGSSYLVYAYLSEPTWFPYYCDGCLVTSICTRTRSMSEASADLLYLDDPESGILFTTPRLYQNYPNPFRPNPFNPVSTIYFFIPHAGEVSLSIYDLAGSELIRLVDGHTQEGYHPVTWSGRNQFGQEVPSGVYIIRLSTPYYTKSIKMLLLK
ncbi:FlgD immunoglobulin-like domain containing protein [Candidatus Neomarinimicrobiota bacterium]